MKRKSLLSIALLGLLMAQACRDTGTKESATHSAAVDSAMKADVITDTAGINRGAGTAEFINDAGHTGLLELELSKLAVQKATNPKVKDFAKMMVKDYSKITEKLKKLADSKKITLPATLPEADQAHLAELQKMDVAGFEKHYMGMIVKNHIKTLDLYKGASTSGDSPLQNFAKGVLKTLEWNYKQATSVHNKLGL
mgnify:CR=1 FL=1